MFSFVQAFVCSLKTDLVLMFVKFSFIILLQFWLCSSAWILMVHYQKLFYIFFLFIWEPHPHPKIFFATKVQNHKGNSPSHLSSYIIGQFSESNTKSQICQEINKWKWKYTWNALMYCIWYRRKFVSECGPGKLRSWRATILQSLAPTLIKHTCL